MPLPNRAKIKITGPLWTAEATLLDGISNGQAVMHRRNIFVDQVAQASADGSAHQPGTMRVLCFVTRVVIQPQNGIQYEWRNNGNAPVTNSVAEIEQAKIEGHAALLVLATDPDIPFNNPNKTYQCLNGDIRLDAVMTPVSNANGRLYNALGLTPHSPLPVSRWGLSVHASGVSLHASFSLPWMDPKLVAPLLLSPAITREEAFPETGHRLSIEHKRLTEDEERFLILSWQRMSRFVNPRNPLMLGNPNNPTPVWVTLELADIRSVPNLYWKIENWQVPSPRLYVHGAEINVIFSNQQLYDNEFPPSAIATVIQREVSIQGNISSGVDIRMQIGNKLTVVSEFTQVDYHWQADALNSTENVDFGSVEMAFSPVEIPQALRAYQNHPAPIWLPGPDVTPIEPSVLWGFVTLDNGWLQAPFLNLTEQIFLDGELANVEAVNQAPEDAQRMIRGAISFGNTQDETLNAYPDENPWNLTIIEAAYVEGHWQLVPDDNLSLKIQDVQIDLQATQLAANGLLWMSSDVPTVNDALPDLSDWINGLENIPLYTHRPDKDLFPAPIYIEMSALNVSLRASGEKNKKRIPSTAILSNWSLEFVPQIEVISHLVQEQIIPLDAFSRFHPLLWLRHRSLPMIQAMPLTQSQLPPNAPNASRQLIPFELALETLQLANNLTMALPHQWRFGVTDDTGANQWIESLHEGTLTPAREWTAYADLPLVSLSLPGLLLDPLTVTALDKDADFQVPIQFRYDLPYSDQIHALAELPKPERDPQLSSPLPDDPPEEQPEPLSRADYANFWRERSIKATLAQVAAAELFARNADDMVIENLLEPYIWEVQSQVALDVYPGSLSLDNQNGTSMPLHLEGEDALEGISGAFSVNGNGLLSRVDPSSNAAMFITAGSAAAFRQDLSSNGNGSSIAYRDQRGLKRSATRTSPSLLRTPVEFQDTRSADIKAYHLVSLFSAMGLQAADSHWEFWFKDLPFDVTSATFTRSLTQSDAAQDINDPEALSRQFNYLNGYEWRLSKGENPKLSLCGLEFYPLSLEEVLLFDDIVQTVKLIGRLQLPLDKNNSFELSELSNAVELTFEHDAATNELVLQAVQLISAIGEWALRLKDKETTDAPMLTWESISYADNALTIAGVELKFYLFDVLWTLAIDDIVFDNQALSPMEFILHHDVNAPIVPTLIILTLDMLDYKHNTTVDFFVQLGDRSVAQIIEPLSFDPAMQLRYQFDRVPNNPTRVSDDAVNDWAFNLTIEHPQRVDWLSDGNLFIKQGTRIRSSAPIGNILNTFKQTNEVSVELRVSLLELIRNKDGGIFSFGKNTGEFNLTIEQEEDELEINIDTNAQGQNAKAKIKTTSHVLKNIDRDNVQLVVTLRGSDHVILYLNGKQIATQKLHGGFSNWKDFPIILGNNDINSRPWLGTLHYVAVFNRVLDPGEIQDRYDYVSQPQIEEDTTLHPAFSTSIRVTLLESDDTAKATGGLYLSVLDANVFDDVPLLREGFEVLHTNRALEFNWVDYDTGDERYIQMLPGMHLNTPSASDEPVLPGFSTCAFDVIAHMQFDVPSAQPQNANALLNLIRNAFAAEAIIISPTASIQAIPDTSDEWLIADSYQLYHVQKTGNSYRLTLSVPKFDLQAAYVELLAHCRWGTFAQIENDASQDQSRESVFGSSAGNLTWNYSSRWLDKDNRWQDIYLLNGMLEITNLISWAKESTFSDNPNSQLTLPAIFAAETFAPHTRHSIRILLNQHEIDSSIPIVAEEDYLIFNFQPRHRWQFLAVVEHQLIDVLGLLDEETFDTGNYRRWTTMQEVRLIRPDDFQHWLQRFNYSSIEVQQWVQTYSYLHPAVRQLLAHSDTGVLGNFETSTLIVEASAPHWVRTSSTTRVKGKTDIQYLPGGTQTAILSIEDDYVPSSVQSPEWLLLTMPFLGRLQDFALDLIGASDVISDSTHPLQVDPILSLFHLGVNASDLVFILSNFAREQALDFAVSAFDAATGRTWARLDPLSLEENWLRLQHTVPEKEVDGIRAVMFSLPDTPARVSRETALKSSFDSFRRISIFTAQDDPLPALPIPTGEIVWHGGQIFVIQGTLNHANAGTLPYSWHLISLQINLLGNVSETDAIQRHAAATLLPVPYEASTSNNGQMRELPVSFAVSPYLGLGFAPASELTPRYIFAELLSLNIKTRRLQVTATQFYDLEIYDMRQREEQGDNNQPSDYEALSNEILSDHALAWARQSHNNLAPESPVAVLRFRVINRDLEDDNTQDAVLNTFYTFTIIDDIAVSQKITRRMFKLRSDVSQLRYRQGQFGGYAMPSVAAHAFELAPPQVNGVQPVYLKERPSGGDGSVAGEREWDWGVSALRFSVQYTEGKQGVLGKVSNGDAQHDDLRLWWQAPQYQVQFRALEDDAELGTARPRAGLPPMFRAPSIRSLMPVLPDAPMPAMSPDEFLPVAPEDRSEEPIMTHWQAILPGHLRYLLVGTRAGAIIAMRNQVLRQAGFGTDSGTETLNSGSVPVQHRIPRPVPLPPNTKPTKALQTWASRFEIDSNCLDTTTPADEAFFAESANILMRRVRLTLAEPFAGVIPPDWDGTIVLDVKAALDNMPDQHWQLTPEAIAKYLAIELLNGNTILPYASLPQDLSLQSAPLPSIEYKPSLPEANQSIAFANIWIIALGASKITLTDTTVTRIDDVNQMPAWEFTDANDVQYIINEVGDNLNIYRAEDRFKLRYKLEKQIDTFTRFASVDNGEILALRVYVLYNENNFDDYKQTLLLPLRNGNPNRLRLPIQPRFVHFEDPEYNRRLASLAGTASREIPIYRLKNDLPEAKLLYTVTLASDRREYNPNSVIAFRYDWLGGIPFAANAANVPKAQIELWRVSKEGATEYLERRYDMNVGQLRQVNLDEIRDNNGNLELQAGDILELRLFLGDDVENVTMENVTSKARVVALLVDDILSSSNDIKGQVTILKLAIVEESVTPVTEAGYALLHAQKVNAEQQVECARFAWSPAATRIELVNPDDLLQETVRRRAVFRWQTSIRPERDSQLAIQKITLTGSTHFPEFLEVT